VLNECLVSLSPHRLRGDDNTFLTIYFHYENYVIHN
jgi:hypothetical protein